MRSITSSHDLPSRSERFSILAQKSDPLDEQIMGYRIQDAALREYNVRPTNNNWEFWYIATASDAYASEQKPICGNSGNIAVHPGDHTVERKHRSKILQIQMAKPLAFRFSSPAGANCHATSDTYARCSRIEAICVSMPPGRLGSIQSSSPASCIPLGLHEHAQAAQAC